MDDQNLPDGSESEWSIEQLNRGESLLLGAVRVWVAKYRKRQCGLMDIAWMFRRFGIARAAPSLHAVMMHLSIAAERSIDIRCCKCPKVSPDETRLMDLVAHLQDGEEASARAILRFWLAPAAARLSMVPAWALAEVFRDAGLMLPLRTVRTVRDEKLIELETPINIGGGGPTLH
jgi:hypothetical protein